MVPISELEDRILGELEEAGEDNVASMINTIITPFGKNNEKQFFAQALSNLVSSDYIRISYHRALGEALSPLSQDESQSIIDQLPENLSFDTRELLWKSTVDPRPEILITPKGRERAVALINERGYDWYIPYRGDRTRRAE